MKLCSINVRSTAVKKRAAFTASRSFSKFSPNLATEASITSARTFLDFGPAFASWFLKRAAPLRLLANLYLVILEALTRSYMLK